jgi:hypothetical protein
MREARRAHPRPRANIAMEAVLYSLATLSMLGHAALPPSPWSDSCAPRVRGETSTTPTFRVRAADHPRVRGENLTEGNYRRIGSGSPPRARGKRTARVCRDGVRGITPVCAEKTLRDEPIVSHTNDIRMGKPTEAVRGDRTYGGAVATGRAGTRQAERDPVRASCPASNPTA